MYGRTTDNNWQTCIHPVHTWVYLIVTDMETIGNKIRGDQLDTGKVEQEFTGLLEQVGVDVGGVGSCN